MSPTTRRLRETSFFVESCDVSPDMTLEQYRRRGVADATAPRPPIAALRGRRLRRAHRG